MEVFVEISKVRLVAYRSWGQVSVKDFDDYNVDFREYAYTTWKDIKYVKVIFYESTYGMELESIL